MNFPFKSLLRKIIGVKILGGPFKGMRYSGETAHSVLLPKVLGTYECEIAEDIVSLIGNSQTTIINVGCAEGYYANGALKLNPVVHVIAFDTEVLAQKACQAIASRNGYEQRMTVGGFCDGTMLNDLLASEHADLLIVDAEGYERVLLDPQNTPNLLTTSILVEIHESTKGEMSQLLLSRFSESHIIKQVSAREPSWRDIEHPVYRTLARLSPQIEKTFVFERPSGMSWLIMQTKATSPLL
jgi:hypothetical protein